ncbi:MAG: diguanylate cyclase domain-containing protein [Acidimicrobiales bacterium]
MSEHGSVVDTGAMLSMVPDPVVVVSAEGTVLWANDMAEATFGWSFTSFEGRDATELVHPDDLPTAMASLESVQSKAAGTLVEIRVRDHTGNYRRVEVRGRSAIDVPGVGGVVLMLRDITDRRRWELVSGDAAASAAVLEALPTIALVLTPDGRIESANRAFTGLLGHPLEDTLRRPLTDFVSVAKVLSVADHLASLPGSGERVTFETDLVDTEGEPHPMNLTVVDLVGDQSVGGLVATATDISTLAAVRDRLAHAATHDDLTGLPNRMLLHERLDLALSNAAFRDVGVGVVFVDLDDFGLINDSYGHSAGDAALVEVGNRLSAAVRDSDVVARYGGDEFVLVASGLDRRALARLVDRIGWLMRTPVSLDVGSQPRPVEVRLSLSVGAVLAETGITSGEAIERADSAMQRDRSRRRQRHA